MLDCAIPFARLVITDWQLLVGSLAQADLKILELTVLNPHLMVVGQVT